MQVNGSVDNQAQVSAMYSCAERSKQIVAHVVACRVWSMDVNSFWWSLVCYIYTYCSALHVHLVFYSSLMLTRELRATKSEQDMKLSHTIKEKFVSRVRRVTQVGTSVPHNVHVCDPYFYPFRESHGTQRLCCSSFTLGKVNSIQHLNTHLPLNQNTNKRRALRITNRCMCRSRQHSSKVLTYRCFSSRMINKIPRSMHRSLWQLP